MINELPSEVLAHTFDFWTFDPSLFGADNQAEILTTLSTVCRYWRQVLLDHPHFWRKHQLRVTRRLRNEPDQLVQRLTAHLERWFGRAGDFHLNLNITFEVTPRETKTLYNYLIQERRWGVLEFVLDVAQATNWTWLESLLKGAAKWKHRNGGHPCWPNLRSFTIRADGTSFSRGKQTLRLPLLSVAPNLQRLAVNIGHLEDSRPPTRVFTSESIPWGNLKHFEFTGTLPADDHLFWHFHIPDLTKATVLETMVVSYHYAHQMSLGTRPPPVTTPVANYSLTRLTLRAHFDSIYPFLKSLILPSLQFLGLSSTVFSYCEPQGEHIPTPLADSLRTLVERSQCQIKELSLRLLPGHAKDLVDTLATLPTLEWLNVELASLMEESFFSRLRDCQSSSRTPVIPPNLHTFNWQTWKYTLKAHVSLEEEFALFRRDPVAWHQAEVLKKVHSSGHN